MRNLDNGHNDYEPRTTLLLPENTPNFTAKPDYVHMLRIRARLDFLSTIFSGLQIVANNTSDKNLKGNWDRIRGAQKLGWYI